MFLFREYCFEEYTSASGGSLIFVQACQRECGRRSDLERQSSSSRYMSKFRKAVTSAVLRGEKKKYPRNFMCLSSHISMIVTKTIEPPQLGIQLYSKSVVP